ncbi:hypothetical protein WMY93_003366 [Mugilogobius chulae]|uniref:G-protein coupled receptors family 1 profile domain-containing protein n=1 Tax=Mugilogobius chulae TaxID=88201 RepID=A0AAW0Q4P9_9GOBI
MNISSENILRLDGLSQLYDHRFVLAFLFLLLYVFVILSDSLVVYVVCSQRSLHRPMYVFVVAVLVNSALGSSTIYPKLISDLLQGRRVVLMFRSACLCQAFITGSLGSSSFMLLSAMAFDRYLSICHPLHYAALMSPKTVTALLLVCWLVPVFRVAGAMILASHLPICYTQVTRIYCDNYTFVSMSCGGVASQISSASFSTKALNTCLPHVLVFINFSFAASVELLHRRLTMQGATVTASIMVVVIPSVFNPVVYGLKVAEIYRTQDPLCHPPGPERTLQPHKRT